MFGYTVRRILSFIPLLWAVTTVTFFLMHSVPGGPFDRDDSKPLPEKTIAALEQKYNIDGSLWDQYTGYLQDLVKGDLGLSFQRNIPVTDLLRQRYPTTLQLGLSAFAFALAIGLTLGVLAAVYQNSWIDYVSVTVATVGVAVPSFVMAVFLILVF